MMITKNEAKQQITTALQTDLAGYNVAITDIKRIAKIIFQNAFGRHEITRIEKLQSVYSQVMESEFGYEIS